MNHSVGSGDDADPKGILIHKRTAAEHPVDRVYALLGKGGDTDEYLEEIRGR